MEVKIDIAGKPQISLCPGDVLDLGKDGLLKFYPEPEATAMRILQEEHQKKVRWAWLAFEWLGMHENSRCMP